MKKNIYSQPQHSVTLFYTQSLFFNIFFDTQLLRECKDVLLGGVLVKDYYLDLVGGISNSEDLNKENTESDIEGFEQDLQSLLLVILVTILSQHEIEFEFIVKHASLCKVHGCLQAKGI